MGGEFGPRYVIGFAMAMVAAQAGSLTVQPRNWLSGEVAKPCVAAPGGQPWASNCESIFPRSTGPNQAMAAWTALEVLALPWLRSSSAAIPALVAASEAKWPPAELPKN